MSFDLKMSRLFLVGLLTAMLAACSSADVASIDPASQEQIRSVKVSKVTVALDIPQPNPHLAATLTQHLRDAMPKCATGPVDHLMHVRVTNFKAQNVAKSILIGDDIELAGRVSFATEKEGEKAGEYFVKRNFFWGGIVGAAMMSDAEKQLSEGFAESVCKEVFGVEIKAAS